MGRQPIVPTVLECTVCGNRLQIWRKKAKQHTQGHTKHMWCPYCQDVVAFTELREDTTTDSWLSIDRKVENAEYTGLTEAKPKTKKKKTSQEKLDEMIREMYTKK